MKTKFKITSGNILINPKLSRSYIHNPNRWVLFVFGNYEWYSYYHWLIKKKFKIYLNRPENPPHITLISGENIPKDKWEKSCQYLKKNKFTDVKLILNKINSDGRHWWIPVQSKQMMEFRKNLGLSKMPYWPLHFTIGRCKDKELNHSKYLNKILKKYYL